MCCFNFLGTGTFGRVILCRDRQKKSQVSALKVMRITELIRLKQVQHVMSEKSVLLSISHPFIVKLWVYFIYACAVIVFCSVLFVPMLWPMNFLFPVHCYSISYWPGEYPKTFLRSHVLWLLLEWHWQVTFIYFFS